METQIDPQLSAGLQELLLENKEWLSKIIFLEEEMKISHNLFEKLLSDGDKKKYNLQVEMINSKLTPLMVRRKYLKTILNTRNKNIEQLLAGTVEPFDIIKEDVAIRTEIRSLLSTVSLIKNEIFVFIEGLKTKNIPSALPVYLKAQRYPIF